MSSIAGRVMPLPKGEYDSSVTYKVLDIVTYQVGNKSGSYIAKQTTTGNAPTNTTYWQKLAEVDLDGVMVVDASNAVNPIICDTIASVYVDTITKDSGDNKSVTITQEVTPIDSNWTYGSGRAAKRMQAYYDANVGNPGIYYMSNDEKIYLIIDSTSTSSETVTITAHLKEDDSSAISLGRTQLFIESYISSTRTDNLVIGNGAVHGKGTVKGNFVAINGDYASAEGSGVANNNYAHAEGKETFAVSEGSHAEGMNSNAVGYAAHAEGKSYAYSNYAHTEGFETFASGIAAHAEGYNTEATGNYSHASGRGTRAGYECEFSIGRYNQSSANVGHLSLFNVGNGSAGNLSNAFEVLEDGLVNHGDLGESYKIVQNTNHKWCLEDYYGAQNVFSFPIYLDQSVTLSTSGDTTVTFTNDAILSTSMVDVWNDKGYGFAPKSVTTSYHECVVVYDKVDSAETITCRLEVKNV